MTLHDTDLGPPNGEGRPPTGPANQVDTPTTNEQSKRNSRQHHGDTRKNEPALTYSVLPSVVSTGFRTNPRGLGGFALGLAGADLPVLPLLPRTKRPRYKGAFHNATCDTEWISRHWWHHPDDNIGIRPPAGMAVLDVDTRNGGMEQMRQLVAEHGRLPQTWTARTGSGGWHYWFIVGELTPRAHLCPGVDVKTGATGFVVAPPSIHPGGDTYRWRTPPVDEPAMAPDWLLTRLAPPVYTPPPPGDAAAGHGLYSAQCLVSRIESAVEGRRNVTVYGALRDAAKQGDLDAFEPALVAAAVATGLGPAEVAGIVRSARAGGHR